MPHLKVRRRPKLQPLVLLMSLTAAVAAGAGDWTSDPAESRLDFVASYTGSDLPGRFQSFGVDLDFDPLQPEAGRLVVTVDVTSADMGDEDMNEAVTGVVWLDVVGFAEATFTSDDISMLESGEYTASGELELRGVRCPVTVPFAWRDDGERGSMRGELSLQRLDFGIGTGTWAATDEVAADVRVRFDIALDRSD